MSLRCSVKFYTDNIAGVVDPTLANGFLAKIMGLAGAVGLLEAAPSVWRLLGQGFSLRPLTSGAGLSLGSAAALLSMPFEFKRTCAVVRQANLLQNVWSLTSNKTMSREARHQILTVLNICTQGIDHQTKHRYPCALMACSGCSGAHAQSMHAQECQQEPQE